MTTPPRIVINIRDIAGERESAEARRTIAWWLVGLTILMVLFCGMFPFDFTFSFSTAISEIRRRFDPTIDQFWTAGDGLENVVFFLPVGFALGALLWSWRGRSAGWIAIRCGIAVLGAATLSAIVELSQVYLESRDPSLADIVSNTTGGIVGFAVFIAVGEWIMRLLVRLLIVIRNIRDLRVFAVLACAWLAIMIALPIHERHRSDLSFWQADYPLLLGNETDGKRHWDGEISNVWLSAAAVGQDEMETLLASRDPGQALGDSLMMSFHLTGKGPYRDATGHTGDLAWTGPSNADLNTDATEPADLTGVMSIGQFGVPITENWWLRTADGGAAEACTRIARTHAFTVVLDVAMHDLAHGDGWPRIFSISKDKTHCNLSLLQDRTSLELRVRSFASGSLGADPELIVPHVFESTDPERVIVTYDHGRVRIANDQSPERYTVQYSPDAWLVWRIYPRTGWPYRMDSSGQVVASGMYRILAMAPLGLLLGGMLRILKQRRQMQKARMLFIGVVCGAALLLELFLHWAAGVPFSPSSPIVGVLAACCGIVVILGWLPFRGIRSDR